MKLKEFVIWGYKLSQSKSRVFTLFNRSTCAHFERHFEAIDTDFYRIVIKVDKDDERNGTWEESSRVLKYYTRIDFDQFYQLDELARQKFLLDLLIESLLKLCEEFSWSTAPFEEAYNKVLAENFVNEYVFKSKNDPSRKLVANLFCKHTTKAFECSLRVENKKGEILFSKPLFTEVPDEFFFNSRFGDIKWVDKRTLAILKKDKSEIERLSFDI